MCAIVASVLGHWAAILVFMGFSAMIAGTLLAASVFLGKGGRQRGAAKSRPFESGVSTGAYEPYPLAVQLRRLQLFGFMELLLFVVLLGIGYVYIWRKGALEWK